MRRSPANTIAFQGHPGAYSDLACREVYPQLTTLPCGSFEDAIAAVREGRARLAMLPIENSVAGRVADIHHLMPGSGLYIIGEHFQRVNHHLLALPGATLEGLKTVRSHVHALSQCRNLIRALGLRPVVAAGFAPGVGVARALYFSRLPVPSGGGAHYHHIGLYAYRRAALERFVRLPPSPLEKRESLEQLRALEAGMRIDVALVDTVPFGVDTPADLARARELMATRLKPKP